MTQARPRIALFVTCLVDLYRPNVGFAAIKLLEEAGCLVEVPPSQTCCGQPAYNSGDRANAKALARAVVGEPDLVLADEPTGNLDHATGAQVMDLLFGLAGARGATLVLITHDLALARRCARVVRLQDGRIAGDAPAAPAAP